MESSLWTLVNAQAAHAATAPAKPWLAGLRSRNLSLDAVFYDIGVISDEEASAITPWLAREGAILYVPPSSKGTVLLCADADELAALEPAVTSLAVAGVGSSALGSAAFARNVADATGKPVAAVVSGYGLPDLMSEALGGWFLFGYANRSRDPCGSDRTGLNGTSLIDAYTRNSDDTRAVIALLKDDRFAFSLLTGHSKGNLVLSEALFALAETSGELPIDPATRIVTISAAIYLPDAFTNIVDIMGEWDEFGRFNSSECISIDKPVPRAFHHTNTDILGHVPVTKTLRAVLKKTAN